MEFSPYKAVIFDIGGVVVRSPLLAIADFEREIGLPHNYINYAIRDLSDTTMCNAWYGEYCRLRNKACPKLPDNIQINGRDLFGRMMRESAIVDENMVEAIRRIRAADRCRIIALTNNYSKAVGETEGSDLASATSRMGKSESDIASEHQFLGWTEGPTSSNLRALFDDFCDSSAFGMRKPDPEFYLLACRRNNVQPKECVFLDDIGMNLKVAQGLGMKTIHVPIGGSLEAIKELGKELGIDLIGPTAESKL